MLSCNGDWGNSAAVLGSGEDGGGICSIIGSPVRRGHDEKSYTAEAFLKKTHRKDFYLIPTCVPILEDKVAGEKGVYRDTAPGLADLTKLTDRIPRDSQLNEFADRHSGNGPGRFWAEIAGERGRLCVHDSLYLKGEERIVVFDSVAGDDVSAKDFYAIAREITELPEHSA